MRDSRRRQTSIFKGIVIAVLLLVITGIGIYYGGLPIQKLFSGQTGNKTPAVSPLPSFAPSAAPTSAPTSQVPAQTLDKMVEDALQNIKKGSVSKPSVSPDKKKIAYVSPFDWEVIGEVHYYDVEKKKDTVIINSSNVKHEYTPKDVEWLDDRYLLVIVGYGYGTVTVGGDLYILDTKENKFQLAVTAGEKKEFKDIYMENGVLILETAVFNADLTKYTIEKKKMTPAEVLSAIKK